METDNQNGTAPEYASELLDTACRLPMMEPHGQVFYLEMEEGPVSQDGYPTLEMKTQSRFIAAETFRLTADQWNNIPNVYGININLETFSALYNQARTDAERRLYKIYQKLGIASAHELKGDTRWKRFLHHKLRIPAVKYVETSQDMVRTLIAQAHNIAVRSRRGPANWAIVSRQQRVLLDDSPLFTYVSKIGIASASGYEYIGHLPSGLRIFVNHTNQWNDETVIMGRNTQVNEPGVYRGEHSITTDEIAFFDEKHMSDTKRMQLQERSTTVEIGKDAYKSYLAINIRQGKRPLWRRILGI